jgi:hypothetical protein
MKQAAAYQADLDRIEGDLAAVERSLPRRKPEQAKP